MRKKIISAMLALCMAGSLLTGCGTSADAGKKSEDSGDVTTVKWFTSRPVDGAIDQVMHEIADEYSEKMGGKWKIEFETTADRPSYLQKLKTLIAGGNMPDIIVCRTELPLDKSLKDKIALFCNVPSDHVLQNLDVELLYEAPLAMEKVASPLLT